MAAKLDRVNKLNLKLKLGLLPIIAALVSGMIFVGQYTWADNVYMGT